LGLFGVVFCPLKSAIKPLKRGVEKRGEKEAQSAERKGIKCKKQIVDNFFQKADFRGKNEPKMKKKSNKILFSAAKPQKPPPFFFAAKAAVFCFQILKLTIKKMP
jgi:hypothetical protein